MAGHFGDHLGDITGERRLRTDGKPAVGLSLDGVDHEIRCVAEGRLSEAIDQSTYWLPSISHI